MPISQEVLDAGQRLANSPRADLCRVLNACIEGVLGWPYKVASGRMIDSEGATSDAFATVVYTAQVKSNDFNLDAIPADNVATIVDVVDNIDLASLRAAYARIAQAKRLKKSPAPHVPGPPITTITLGIVYAQRTLLPLEKLAEELELLNTRTPGREWPDMLVVGSTGTVQYAVQFPGEPSISGEYLPPAEGALANYIPAIYVVTVMAPTGVHTFNKMTSFLVAHLAIFSPGAKLPLYSDILEGVPKTAVTLSGYQYDLRGDLVPVPRKFYSDRYLPPLPIRIEDNKGSLLSTIQYLPWQDGGVIVLRGQLPLDGLMVFLSRDALAKGGVIRRPNHLQISHVLPITARQFDEMLNRLQTQSNMRVRPSEGQFVIQKLADEGSASPFMARIFLGLMRIRDIVYSDPSARQKFDRPFEQVITSLMNVRSTARELTKLWETHAQKIASGEIARRQGPALQIDQSIDKELS